MSTEKERREKLEKFFDPAYWDIPCVSGECRAPVRILVPFMTERWRYDLGQPIPIFGQWGFCQRCFEDFTSMGGEIRSQVRVRDLGEVPEAMLRAER